MVYVFPFVVDYLLYAGHVQTIAIVESPTHCTVLPNGSILVTSFDANKIFMVNIKGTTGVIFFSHIFQVV